MDYEQLFDVFGDDEENISVSDPFTLYNEQHHIEFNADEMLVGIFKNNKNGTSSAKPVFFGRLKSFTPKKDRERTEKDPIFISTLNDDTTRVGISIWSTTTDGWHIVGQNKSNLNRKPRTTSSHWSK